MPSLTAEVTSGDVGVKLEISRIEDLRNRLKSTRSRVTHVSDDLYGSVPSEVPDDGAERPETLLHAVTRLSDELSCLEAAVSRLEG